MEEREKVEGQEQARAVGSRGSRRSRGRRGMVGRSKECGLPMGWSGYEGKGEWSYVGVLDMCTIGPTLITAIGL